MVDISHEFLETELANVMISEMFRFPHVGIPPWGGEIDEVKNWG
jgi:hypothetical protein